mmetsp:Transcript_377/g.1004  ORF Transcript_377/g.1004 Transcript_377/m.1004 type:complete len:300 (-) Transcript_377:474-1373(-)
MCLDGHDLCAGQVVGWQLQSCCVSGPWHLSEDGMVGSGYLCVSAGLCWFARCHMLLLLLYEDHQLGASWRAQLERGCNCGDGVHIYVVLCGVEHRCLQGPWRQEPVLRPGHWLSRHGWCICSWPHLHGLLQPSRGLRHRCLKRILWDLVQRLVHYLRTCWGSYGSRLVYGVPPKRHADLQHPRDCIQARERILGHLHARVDCRPQCLERFRCGSLLHCLLLDVHDLRLGNRVGRPLQPSRDHCDPLCPPHRTHSQGRSHVHWNPDCWRNLRSFHICPPDERQDIPTLLRRIWLASGGDG